MDVEAKNSESKLKMYKSREKTLKSWSKQSLEQ